MLLCDVNILVYAHRKDMQFSDIGEREIMREGDTLILRPVQPDWLSFADVEKADDDFLLERPDVIADEGRFECFSGALG